jgi:hypothetical protein
MIKKRKLELQAKLSEKKKQKSNIQMNLYLYK